MATVTDARNAVKSMARYGSADFDETEIDVALRWAIERTAKETGLLRTIGTISVVANDITITHGLTRFLPGRRFAPCYTSSSDGYRRIVSVDLADIQAHYDQSTSTNRPEMINFFTATQCMIYPQADATYTINVPYEQTSPTWTLGTPGESTDLGLPDSIVYGGMLWGAKFMLLSGFDNAAREARDAQTMFEQFLIDNKDAGIDLSPTLNPYFALHNQSYIGFESGD